MAWLAGGGRCFAWPWRAALTGRRPDPALADQLAADLRYTRGPVVVVLRGGAVRKWALEYFTTSRCASNASSGAVAACVPPGHPRQAERRPGKPL